MKTQSFCLEILTVLLLSVIPWPGPSIFKISCPRERASTVRRIVHRKWTPILKKYHVELPLECPFHGSRDIFYPQQAAKHQHRPSQWTCGLCGKSFYSEKHLDAHFDNRHRSNVNTAEDAVCLADYCDIMRCDVHVTRDFEDSLTDDSGSLNTDIQVWKGSTACRTSVAPSEPRELARMYLEQSYDTDFQRYCQRIAVQDGHRLIDSSYKRENAGPDNKSNDACESDDNNAGGGTDDNNNNGDDGGGSGGGDDDDDNDNLVKVALPSADRKQQDRAFEFQRLKANCKPEELQKLKFQCKVLVRDCIAGLLANLSVREFQEIEGELDRAICWYLSCDRYWEDVKKQQRHTPLHLLIAFLIVLSVGIYVCYYIVWVLFNNVDEAREDSAAESLAFDDGDNRAGFRSHDSSVSGERKADLEGEDSSTLNSADVPDYLYVAYPPELKRRLLESCYNRTTRL